MKTVNIAQLKAKLSHYIRTARAGETIRILDRHTEVVRRIGVSERKGQRVAGRLVEDGVAQWGGGKPDVNPVKPRKGTASIADAVSADRNDSLP